MTYNKGPIMCDEYLTKNIQKTIRDHEHYIKVAKSGKWINDELDEHDDFAYGDINE